MAKRTVTRVGDVFCVEFDGEYKRYFQYAVKDSSELMSAVIQIFSRRYPIDYQPDLEEIVNDKVAMHIHTFIQIGLKAEAWYKVGNSKKINQKALEEVIFGDALDFRIEEGGKIVEVDPLKNWTVWKPNDTRFSNIIVPQEMWPSLSMVGIHPFTAIVEWMRYGYFRRRYESYRMCQRVPWDYVDSYTKWDEGNNVVYSHFHGEGAVREIIMPKDGVEAIRLSTEHPKSCGRELRKAKFWETNWERENFITEEEFNSLWEG